METNSNSPRTVTKKSSRTVYVGMWVSIVIFIIIGYGLGIINPPQPRGNPILIQQGMNAQDIAGILRGENIIRSEYFFVWSVYIGGVHDRLSAGRFVFTKPLSMIEVISRLKGTQKEITVVIPEGLTAQQIGDILERAGIGNVSDFIEKTKGDFASVLPYARSKNLEGFLFPDTYRFYELVTQEEVITKLLENFVKKVRPFEEEIAQSQHDLYEILTMASILEREARDAEDQALVAGILWKRLEEDALLQVDATLWYITGKASHELTLNDLTINDPYNSYRYKNLPPTPISNPGLATITAALRPLSSPYYFYLSDAEGNIHYARTYEEHRRNKLKYIK